MPDNIHNGKRPIVAQGPSLLHHTVPGMEFDSTRDYSYCRICGKIYQPGLNRVPEQDYTAEVVLAAMMLRRDWSHKHAKAHSPQQHKQLQTSGRHCTPEALHKLVPFGIIPVSDIALDNESEHAGLQAPRAPSNDVEGVRW